MPANMLHHFTILSDDVDKTAAFFRTAIGLTDGFAPSLGNSVIWLYTGDQPVVHIVGRDDPGAAGCGRIDHVAFQCTDYVGFKAKLDRLDIPQKEQTLTDAGVHQIFVESPESVWVELVFPLEEYERAQALESEPA